MDQMPSIQRVLTSEQKGPPLPVHDTKMPSDDQMPAKKQKRGKFPYYEIEEDFMEDPNYRKMFMVVVLLLFIST